MALLAPVYWWSIGLPFWPDAAIQVAVAAGVFVVLAATFYMGMMGGGDVKLAAALALWFKPFVTLKILVIMSLAGGILTLIVFLRRGKAPIEGEAETARPEVPYGVASQSARFGFSPNAFLTNLPDLWGRFLRDPSGEA